MRTSSLLTLLALAACSQGQDAGNRASPTPAATASFPVDDTVACAISTAPLAKACGVDQQSGPGGTVLTIRRPDGGFRRLLIARDGRGVIAADGAQPAKVTIVAPGVIEVVVADERYRLPATVKDGR